MNDRKVCAVIVTYNGVEWIEQCIKSLHKSSIPIDVYVVDNHSQDQTLEILDKLNCTFLHHSNKNLGFGKANNVALKQAYADGYDYFLLLNQDARVDPEVTESLIDSMLKESNFGITSPMHMNWSGDQYDPFFKSYLSRMNTYQEDLKVNEVKSGSLYESFFINAACWMVSREALKKVGLFHPLFYHYGEDDNYLNRLRYHGLKLGLSTKVKMYHDRDNRGANPLKDDPHKLFKRTLLALFLDPSNDLSNKELLRSARKLAKNLSKQFSGLSRIIFRISCRLEYFKLKNEVKEFMSHRQHELHIE